MGARYSPQGANITWGRQIQTRKGQTNFWRGVCRGISGNHRAPFGLRESFRFALILGIEKNSSLFLQMPGPVSLCNRNWPQTLIVPGNKKCQDSSPSHYEGSKMLNSSHTEDPVGHSVPTDSPVLRQGMWTRVSTVVLFFLLLGRSAVLARMAHLAASLKRESTDLTEGKALFLPLHPQSTCHFFPKTVEGMLKSYTTKTGKDLPLKMMRCLGKGLIPDWVSERAQSSTTLDLQCARQVGTWRQPH